MQTEAGPLELPSGTPTSTFALLAHTDKATVDPLDLDQWVFFVLPTAVLDGRTRSQHSITLKTLEGLTPAVSFGELRQAVERAAKPATLP